MAETRSRGYCCTTPGAIGFWIAAFLVLYGSGLLMLEVWPDLRGYEEALLFAGIGLACLANFAWNRTFHCAITGPLFLVAAGAMAMNETGAWHVPMSLVWGVILIVGGLALLLEQKFAGADSSPSWQ